MTLVYAFAASLALATLVEVLLPGRSLYQSGSFAVIVVAITLIAISRVRRIVREERKGAAWAWSVSAGCALLGVALAANALFAPQPRRIIGAPGVAIAAPELHGRLRFPTLHAVGKSAGVTLIRAGGGKTRIAGGGHAYLAAFLLKAQLRHVVLIAARDRHGGHLTITQPQGSAFLSPVLLMRTRQHILGLNLPFDEFALPGVHRLGTAVLFSPKQAATLHRFDARGEAALLFVLTDDVQHSLPSGIAIARSGQRVRVANITMRGTVLRYPAVEVLAIPYLPFVGLGLFGILGSLFLRSGEPPQNSVELVNEKPSILADGVTTE